jgi:hypothetical protein
VRRPSMTSFAAGAVAALVLGSGTAVAATGGKFILGHGNSAGAVSTLTNSRGPALSLKSKAGTPSLVVGSRTKVANLNADTVDGVDSTKLARTAGQSGHVVAAGVSVDTDEDGVNDAVVAAATCPAGSRLTGGGISDYTDTGYQIENAPDTGSNDTWLTVVGIDGTNETNPELYASAVCYNPAGAFRSPAAARRTVAPLSHLSPAQVRKIGVRAAATR